MPSRENNRNQKETNRQFSRSMQKKLTLVFVAVVAAFLCLVGRITYINAKSGGQYEINVLSQLNYDSRVIPFRRGNITDRNGTILAASERVYNVIMDAAVLNAASNESHVEPTLNALAEQFGLERDTLRSTLNEKPDSRYIVLKKQVDYDTARAWNERYEEAEDLAGIWLEEDYLRTYPYGSLACDVIGFTSSGNVGNWGVEQYYNDELNGTNGREYGYLSDKTSLERTVKEATDGHNIVTTIDTNLQGVLERYLRAFYEEHAYTVEARTGAENIGAILMDPDTGEILAMASLPNFDLNDPRDLSEFYDQDQIDSMSDEEQLNTLQGIWRNFCVNDTYEPGSTAKVFTVAAGYETGNLSGEETYDCPGWKEVSDHIINCHDRDGHGEITLEEAITKSCNVALMDIALDMGERDFYRYQRVFGFGEYTEIDLPGEADTSGLVYDGNGTAQSDLATNSFGQNYNCTMVQMAAAYCSLINGGHYYRPYVVKSITDSDGDILKSTEPVLLKETVTRETSEILRSYMRSTVENGTATGAQTPGYDVGGKTGTAERLPRGNEEYVISFAGFAPVDDPRVMLYIVIDRPNAESQEDISLVTEMASSIFSEILPYLNINAY